MANEIPNTVRPQRSKIPAISIDGYNLGGIADSIYTGNKGSLAQIVGLDLHSKPGTMQVNQKLSPLLSGPLGYGQIINPSNEAKLLTGSDIYADVKGLGGDNEYQAMSFVAIYSNITSVDLRITFAGLPTDSIKIDILNTLTGPSMASATIPATSLLTPNGTYINFKLNSPISVTPNQTYFIKVSRTGARDTTNYFRLTKGSPNLYQNGSLWTSSGNFWFNSPTKFIDFTVNVNSFRADLYKMLECSDGNIYFFGRYKGDILKMNSAGVFTLLGNLDSQTTPFKICDAQEYNSFIYIATPNTLFQWDFTQSLSTIVNFGSFITNTVNHQMMVHGQVLTLFIADGSNVDQVYAPVGQAATFSTKAVQINAPFSVTALGQQGTNLLIGASILKNVSNSLIYPNLVKSVCRLFVWDTFSTSFNFACDILEPCFNAFISYNTTILFSAGITGNIYFFDGTTASIVKTIQGNYSATSYNWVATEAVNNKNGIPLFALSNNTISDANQNLINPTSLGGLYTFGGRTSNYPTILTLEYPVSTGNLTNILIFDVINILNVIYITYFDQNTGQILVDKLDSNNKYPSAYFDTLTSMYSKEFLDRYKKFIINYELLPSGTSLDMQVNTNGNGFTDMANYVPDPIIPDTDRNQVVAVTDISARTLQMRVMFGVLGNLSPIVQDGLILME